MSRNLKQFCLFFKIHLDFLSVANSTLDDVEIKIHDLVGSKLHFSLWQSWNLLNDWGDNTSRTAENLIKRATGKFDR